MIKKENKLRKPYLTNYNALTSSLSNLVNNVAEGIHKIKCKYAHDDKSCETWGMQFKNCDCFHEHTNFKEDLVE